MAVEMKGKQVQVYLEFGLAILLIILLVGLAAKEKKIREQKTQQSVQEQKESHEVAENEEETHPSQPVEEVIADGQYPIMGESIVTANQMAEYFLSMGQPYPAQELAKGGASDLETFCEIYCEEASAEGVRPEVAFVQTMKETGFLQFGGDVSIEQFNFAGLGTTGGGVPGNSYPDVRTGVRAQIQHLKAYATEDTLQGACVDERYEYVKKGSAPYVEWLGQQENPLGVGWATAEDYGYSIVEMIKKLKQIG